jgi:hypothetical protein
MYSFNPSIDVTNLSNHVVDEPVFVPDTLGDVVSLVFLLIDLLQFML